MAFAVIYGVIFSIALLVIGGYTLYIIFYKRDEDPRDATILRNNFMSQYTQGHAEGIIIKFIKGSSRIGVVILPKDVDYLQHYKGGKYEDVREKEILFWVEKEKLHFYPKGTASDHRHIVEVEPLSPDDINENMKNTMMGKMMMNSIADNNQNKTAKDFVIDELVKTQQIIKSHYVGELTPLILDRLDDLSFEIAKFTAKDKDKKPSTPFISHVPSTSA